jgi:cytochrome P450
VPHFILTSSYIQGKDIMPTHLSGTASTLGCPFAKDLLTADDIDEPDFNLDNNSPTFVYSEYGRLRKTCPVARSSALGGYWLLTRYEDVKFAASRSDIFLSSVKAVVPSDPRGLRRPPLNFDAPVSTAGQREAALADQDWHLYRLTLRSGQPSTEL